MAEGGLLKSVTIKRGKDTPAKMCRGVSAAADGKCYFMSHEDTVIRVYDVEKDDWSVLRPALYENASLAVINGMLTTIGGKISFTENTNVLQSLVNRRWMEKFPPMPLDTALGIDNRKGCSQVVQSGNSVIVIGGDRSGERVDILDTTTSVWTGAHQLPYSISGRSATVCGDEIYVESDGRVLQCFLDELKDDSKPEGSVWNKVADAPHGFNTTIGSLCGQPVSIGGKDYCRSINAYDPNKDCWYEIGKMAIGRMKSIVAQLADDKIVVVGGASGNGGMAIDVTVTEIITGVV